VIKYRDEIYEYLCKEKYQHNRRDKVRPGEFYEKQIPLLYEDYKQALKLYSRLKKLRKKELKKLKEKMTPDWFHKEYFTGPKLDVGKLTPILRKICKEQIKSPFIHNSMQIMRGMAVLEEIKKDKVTRGVYNKLKKVMSRKKIVAKPKIKTRSPNDWYKEFLEIKCTHALDIWHKNKFPMLKMIPSKEEFKKILIEKTKIKAKKLEKVNFQLFLRMLKAVAHGILDYSTLKQSQGESIDCQSQNLEIIKAKKYRHKPGGSIGTKFKSFLKLDYVKMPLSTNKKLPDWLTVKLENEVIYLYGTPASSDVGEYMIQIIDIQEFICKEFYIKVEGKGSKGGTYRITDKIVLKTNGNKLVLNNRKEHAIKEALKLQKVKVQPKKESAKY